MRSATPPLSLELVNEKIPEGVSPVVALLRLWEIVGLKCTFYNAGPGGKALVAVWIVTVVMMFACDLVLWKKQRFGCLRGILKVCWACA